MKEEKILPIEEIESQRKYMARMKAENDAFCAENGFRKGAFVLTFGCQQNEADSEKISGMAESMGYELVSIPEDAYLIVVNTCAIREHAEQKALSIVGQYKHLKQKWKVSMAAMIRRAYNLQIIDSDAYQYLVRTMQRRYGTSVMHFSEKMIFPVRALLQNPM